MSGRRWPDCNAVKVLDDLRWLDGTWERTLTCAKPALHLGKHHDYYAGFTWERGSITDDSEAIRRLRRVRAPR